MARVVVCDVGTLTAGRDVVSIVMPPVYDLYTQVVCIAAEKVEGGHADVAVHRRRQEADGVVAAVQGALHPADEVVGQRLHVVVEAHAEGVHGGLFAGGDGVDDAHRPAAGRSPRQLGGAENGGLRGDVGEVAVGVRPARRLVPDAA